MTHVQQIIAYLSEVESDLKRTMGEISSLPMTRAHLRHNMTTLCIVYWKQVVVDGVLGMLKSDMQRDSQIRYLRETEGHGTKSDGQILLAYFIGVHSRRAMSLTGLRKPEESPFEEIDLQCKAEAYKWIVQLLSRIPIQKESLQSPEIQES